MTLVRQAVRPLLQRRAEDPAYGSASLGGGYAAVTVSSFIPERSLEKQSRRTILDDALARVFGGRQGLINQPVRALRLAIIKKSRTRRTLARRVQRLTKNGGDLGTEIATTVASPLSPLQCALGLKQIRDAALLFHKDPTRQKEARQQTLLGITEVGLFAFGLSSANPVGLLVASSLSLFIKGANLIYKVFARGHITEDKDKLKQTASKIAEKPVIKQCINGLLRLIHGTDRSLSLGVRGLKNGFSSAATKEQRKIGLKTLSEFHQLYRNYYPEAQTEKRENMAKFLSDRKDAWNLHTIEQSGKMIGGFTCFHINDSKYGKQLYIEQLIPPAHLDPDLNRLAWEHIQQFAKENGINRIWLETPGTEKLPKDFKELDILYAQPTLTGRVGSPVGLKGRHEENKINSLRMSAFSVEPSTPGPSYHEFHKVIVQGCIAAWARRDDPAWIKLNQNPTTFDLIPYR